jgi:large subunit ribosomal protein L30
MAGKLKITQTRSTISHIARNRATIKALGLHGIGSASVVADNPATRGMVRQVRFLVDVEEIAETADSRSGKSRSKDRGADTSRSEDRGDAPASHRSEDSQDRGDAPASRPSEDSKEKE